MHVACRLRTKMKFATCSEPRICTLACAVVVMCSSWPLAARRFGMLRFAGALRYCFRTDSKLSLQRETEEPVSTKALILYLPMLMVTEGLSITLLVKHEKSVKQDNSHWGRNLPSFPSNRFPNGRDNYLLHPNLHPNR